MGLIASLKVRDMRSKQSFKLHHKFGLTGNMVHLDEMLLDFGEIMSCF